MGHGIDRFIVSSGMWMIMLVGNIASMIVFLGNVTSKMSFVGKITSMSFIVSNRNVGNFLWGQWPSMITFTGNKT